MNMKLEKVAESYAFGGRTFELVKSLEDQGYKLMPRENPKGYTISKKDGKTITLLGTISRRRMVIDDVFIAEDLRRFAIEYSP